jgi:hypothetical protein
MVGEYRLSTSTGVEPSAHRHESHRQLLTGAGTVEVKPGQVDAIIMPTARPVAYLRQAIALADQLGCTLLVLCSKLAKAPDAAKARKESRVSIVAIDTDGLPSGLVPNFKTSAVLRGNRFNRRTDTSIKRNLIAPGRGRRLGANRLPRRRHHVPRPDDLLDAAGLLASHAAVGLSHGGYPDSSVVCHAYREAGGPQDAFIGGGALAVEAASFTSFFPNIYNEDWFFLLDDDRLRSSTATGLAVQSPYDPFSDVRRARSEELGDCLAEGVFSLLDTGDGYRTPMPVTGGDSSTSAGVAEAGHGMRLNKVLAGLGLMHC